MNYQIKSNLPISGSHWGLIFRGGVAVTEDRRRAERMREHGYEVTELAEPVPAVAPVLQPEVIAEESPATEPEPVAEQPVEPEKFVCPKCGKEYKSETAFKKHVAKCEG